MNKRRSPPGAEEMFLSTNPSRRQNITWKFFGGSRKKYERTVMRVVPKTNLNTGKKLKDAAARSRQKHVFVHRD